ncbi:intraflagellar transport protein 46 homolog isoform X3 [Anopheles funestus]|uniref:intraflagellar transport protein 46 homolog isoform X3 n=1 Tax=Anopheles funestus TaxID=62324 RepID=UPI0020C5C733|nr:intraflagellar transport protein 46 homolog isoform X3 [Anopheles funestus]
MDLYDEMYEIKNGREIDDSPPPDLDVSSSLQFINQEDDEDDEDEEDHPDGREQRKPFVQESFNESHPMSLLEEGTKVGRVDSSASMSDDEKEPVKKLVEEKEFNPKLYENIDAPSEVKDLFQYISRYTPQRIAIEFKLKIFIPEFIPAVGDIDAFLKVCPPGPVSEKKSKKLNGHIQNLGLMILDEPCGDQSDSVLLQMKLRSIFTKPIETPSAIVRSARDIDRWITEIQALRASQSIQSVNAQKQPIVNIDSLMSEWPEEMERTLDTLGFPSAKLDCSLTSYIKIICNIFDIPLPASENQADYIYALYNLFNLFLAIKQQNSL